MKNVFLYTIFFVLTAFTGDNKLSENNYRIYSVKQDKEIKLDDIVTEMKNYDVVFFGEEHNDSVGHYLEAELLKKLHTTYGEDVTLALEMFETDCQTVLNEYLQGFIRERNFIKEARAWSNYQDYKPLIEFSKENKIDVIAGNAPSRYVNLAARKGRDALMSLPDISKSHLPPLPFDTATGDYYQKLTGVSHSTQKSATDTTKKKSLVSMHMPPFAIHSQSLWDASMAYSISEYFKNHKNKKIMQVNGRFHSDEFFGIVAQLKKYNPTIRIMVISTHSDESFPKVDYSQYSRLANYIISTDPKIPKTFKDGI